MYRTAGRLVYNELRVSVPHRHYFNFRVEACRGAIVAMYSRLFGIFAYEVHIGGDDNNIIDIRSLAGGVATSMIYRDALNCLEARPYWVAWKDGLIQVGRGTYPNTQLVSWQDPDSYPVNTLALLSWTLTDPVPALWSFGHQAGIQITSQLHILSGLQHLEKLYHEN